MYAITTPAAFVEFVMLLSGGIMGLSHIVQPGMWAEYFGGLAERGRAGVVTKIMQVELWPALLIVSLHQVWSGPGIVVTVLGWLLLTKVAVGLLAPNLALRSMRMAEGRRRSFVPAGVALLVVSGFAGAALVFPS
jgi:hypothetical protein